MLWHYTTLVHLSQILHSGYLRMTPMKPLPGQTQGVWFTTSPVWEPTAAKRMTLGGTINIGITDFETLHDLMGLARVGVDEGPAYLTFKEYLDVCSPEHAMHLMHASTRMAEEIGWTVPHGPDLWRVCLTEVSVRQWRSVQVYVDGLWQDYSRFGRLDPNTYK